MSAPADIERKLSTPFDDHVNLRESFTKSKKEAPAKSNSTGCVPKKQSKEIEEVDVVLIGGGIMSATLGLLLKLLEPSWKIVLYERLGSCGEESSNGWNNAGTGHSALCELNYTKENKDGSINHAKAVSINEQFQLSRQFWSYLVEQKLISNDWICTTPHMSFVTGEKNVNFLSKRFDILSKEPLFQGMEFSTDPEKIKTWAPLLVEDRDLTKPVAATFSNRGTDVDFGVLTKQMVRGFTKLGGTVLLYHTVTGLKQQKEDGKWLCTVKRADMASGKKQVKAKFVFAGAGGWALLMLQKARVPGVRGYAGGPVSGQFLVCQNPDIASRHEAKVYTKGEIGAPPMSEPHLDARVIEGKPLLLFGPYAGLNTRFLKTGTLFDAFKMIKCHNIIPLIGAALQNMDLVFYLLGMLAATRKSRMADLHLLMPSAKPEDWTLITAGMRVQVIKKDPSTKKYVFQFGTEVVTAPDGSIVGLLGASPGASTAVQVCLDVIQKCYKDQVPKWEPKLKQMVPGFGVHLSKDPSLAAKLLAHTSNVLGLKY